MADAKKCDRCGKFIDLTNIDITNFVIIGLRSKEKMAKSKICYDLCDECATLLSKWFANEAKIIEFEQEENCEVVEVKREKNVINQPKYASCFGSYDVISGKCAKCVNCIDCKEYTVEIEELEEDDL